MQHLLEQGIATRRGIMLAHREKPFRNARGIQNLAASECASDHSVLLPLYPAMDEKTLTLIVACLLAAI
jgi:dTDP-4-amino-4,6-dideoxygalactose transaminase